MKQSITHFFLLVIAMLTSSIALADTSTWVMNTTDGIAEVTVVKQGASDPGGDLELTKDGITVTSAAGYFKGSGTNGIQIYKTGTMTVTAPVGYNITSIVFQYPKDCYPFAEALNEGGSSTTKTPAQVDVTFKPEKSANAFTFTNEAVGQTKVKKMVIEYEIIPVPFDFTAVPNEWGIEAIVNAKITSAVKTNIPADGLTSGGINIKPVLADGTIQPVIYKTGATATVRLYVGKGSQIVYSAPEGYVLKTIDVVVNTSKANNGTPTFDSGSFEANGTSLIWTAEEGKEPSVLTCTLGGIAQYNSITVTLAKGTGVGPVVKENKEFDITNVTNNGNVPGDVDGISKDFVITLPEGAELVGNYNEITLNIPNFTSGYKAQSCVIDGTTATVNFNNLLDNEIKPGEYTLNIPAGKFKYETETEIYKNEAYTGTWNLVDPADGTLEHPFVIEAGKQYNGPQSGVVYYQYTADNDGVVSISNTFAGSANCDVTVNGQQVRSWSNLAAVLEVKGGDVVVYGIRCEGDESAKTFTLNFRQLSGNETVAGATELAEGSNNIAGIASGALPQWYKLNVPAGKTATIAIAKDLYIQATAYANEADAIAGANAIATSLNSESPITWKNEGSEAATIYVKVSGTNAGTDGANVSVDVTIGDGTAKFSHLGDLAWSVTDGKLAEAASYITVTFPNAEGGNDDTPVVLDNVYILELVNGNQTGAPLNLGGVTSFQGTLGNGVNINFPFQLNKEYQVQVGNVTVDNSYNVPNQSETQVGNNMISFYVGEKQAVEESTIELVSAFCNGKINGSEIESMSNTITVSAFMPGLTKINDAVKIGVKLSTFGSWMGEYPCYLDEVNGTDITFHIGGEFMSLLGNECDWTFVLPEGLLTDETGAVKNQAAEFTWTVKAGGSQETIKAPEATAAANNGNEPGEVAALGNDFVITYDVNLQNGWNTGIYLMVDGERDWNATITKAINENQATITVSDVDMTQPGEYTLCIPYGAFAHAKDSESVCGTSEFTWTVTGQKDPEGGITADFDLEEVLNAGNAAGSTVESVSYAFTVTIPEGAEINYEAVPTLNNYTGSIIPSDATHALVRFMAQETYTEAGDYVLTIPAGAFTYGEYKNNTYTGTWTVDASATHGIQISVATPEAGQGLESLGTTFTVTGSWASVTEDYDNRPYLLRNGEKIDMYAQLYIEDGVGTIQIGYNDFYVGGTYELIVPEKTFFDADGNYNFLCSRQWTVTDKEMNKACVSVSRPTSARKISILNVKAEGYDDIRTVDYYDYTYNNPMPYLTKDNETEPCATAIQMFTTYDENDEYMLSIGFDPAITEDGTYYLHIPANTLGASKEDWAWGRYDVLAEEVVSQAFEVDSSIEPEKLDWSYEVDVEAEVETLEHIILTFSNLAEVNQTQSLNNDGPVFGALRAPATVPEGIYLLNKDTEETIPAFNVEWNSHPGMWGPEHDFNAFDIWFDGVPAGSYTLIIPEATFVALNSDGDKLYNAPITLDITSKVDAVSIFDKIIEIDPTLYELTVDAEALNAKVDFFDDWSEDTPFVYAAVGEYYDVEAPAEAPYLLNTETGVKYYGKVSEEYDYSEYNNYYNIDFSETEIPDGAYTLVIPQGTLFFNTWVGSLSICNQAAEIVKEGIIIGDPSGIATLKAAEKAGVKMYNLNGARVNSSAKGVIIMNGKKTFVK